jgi:UDP-N-acetylglucosamine enolpyruvyl transferase
MIKITGVDTFKPSEHKIIGDRIEAGTYAIAVAMTGGEIEMGGIDISALLGFREKFDDTGAKLLATKNGVIVKAGQKIKSIDISTAPFPGFATDMQAQFMALMTIALACRLEIQDKDFPPTFSKHTLADCCHLSSHSNMRKRRALCSNQIHGILTSHVATSRHHQFNNRADLKFYSKISNDKSPSFSNRRF